jgi:hypothetical protein
VATAQGTVKLEADRRAGAQSSHVVHTGQRPRPHFDLPKQIPIAAIDILAPQGMVADACLWHASVALTIVPPCPGSRSHTIQSTAAQHSEKFDQTIKKAPPMDGAEVHEAQIAKCED